MADASACFDALEPFLVKFRVLAQLQPGDVVSIDESGNWSLAPASSWRSGLRAFWSFIRGQQNRSQRSVFLSSARESIRSVQRNLSLLMRTAVFLKATDETGCLSRAIVSTMTTAEIEEIEAALQTLNAVCSYVLDGLRGIAVMKSAEPYGKDATFCSELDVTIKDSLLHFLDSVHRRVGPDYADRVFPYLASTDPAKRIHNNIAWLPSSAPSPGIAAGWTNAPGSIGPPLFYSFRPASDPPKPLPTVGWTPAVPAASRPTMPLPLPVPSMTTTKPTAISTTDIKPIVPAANDTKTAVSVVRPSVNAVDTEPPSRSVADAVIDPPATPKPVPNIIAGKQPPSWPVMPTPQPKTPSVSASQTLPRALSAAGKQQSSVPDLTKTKATGLRDLL